MKLLKATIEKECPDSALTADERHRNRVGKVYCYTYDAAVNDTVPSCNRDIGLPNIVKCNSRVDILENHSESTVSFKPELVPGTKIPYPGFPSLNVLPMDDAELKPCGINCFGFPSKYPNMILTMRQLPQLPGATQLAGNLIGKHIFVNWPMMHEAKVVAVLDSSCEVRIVKKQMKTRNFNPPETERWNSVSEIMVDQYLVGAGYPGSGGVAIGDVQIRLKVVPLQGMKTSPVDGSSKKLFGNEEAEIPLQLALFNSPAPDPRFMERGPMKLKDRFPPKCRVVLTKGKYRGCIGTVLNVVDDDKVGVKVQVIPPEPPFGLAIARSVQESYISASDAAKVLRMDPRIFGKITGNLFFSPGRYDLGLNLKYKDKRCVLGYTRVKRDPNSQRSKKENAKAWMAGDTVLVVGSKRMNNTDSDSGEDDKERVFWEYTPKAVRLVAAYKNAFPHLFASLAKAPDERFYDAKRVFGAKGEEMLPKVLSWLKSTETASMPRIPDSTDAMPVAAVHAVQRAADVRTATLEKDEAVKDSNVRVPASALYREGSTAATDVLLASEHSVSAPPELGDRVANLCANGVPFGARGTVVAIHDPSEGCVEVVMDEEFIGGSTLQGTCANFRGKLCVWNHLLKVSAADSKGIVDNVMPLGSGKAVVDKLMKDIQVADTSSVAVEADPVEASAKSKASRTTPTKQRNQSGRDPTNPWGSPQRPNSTTRGGGRQAGWKEAKAPPDNGIGFDNWRTVKNGQKAWNMLVSGKGSNNNAGSNKSKPVPVASDKSASDGLKAMLKIGGSSEPAPAATSSASNMTDGLKAMIGVASVPTTAPSTSSNAPPPPSSPSAADKLMQLMMQDVPVSSPLPAMPLQQTPQSAFNFTYVKEGDEQPPAVNPGQYQQPMMPMQMPMQVFNPMMMNQGGMNPMIMQPVYGMGMTMHMPNQGVPSAQQPAAPRPANREQKPRVAKTPVPMVPSVVVKSKK